MGGEAAVQVAVRMRPFNGREKSMNAKRCIDMNENTTEIYEEDAEDTDSDPRLFSFDFSMWSHFDFNTTEGGPNPDRPERPNVDQDYCYQLVGKKLLDYMWEGYDVCMFAYGQSGAGKSFSMTGTGPKCAQKWKGIIPRISADTFVKAKEVDDAEPNSSFKITASMLEIYVGKIYDLLIPPEKYNIKTRPELDMQMDTVAGLSLLPVLCEDDVTDLLVRGFGNQTKAPTGLNVDSSRGHTIFTLEVNKKIVNPTAKKKSEKEQTLTTAMKLVDLAGSERTEKVLEITKEQLEKLLTEKYGKAMKVTDKMMAEYKAERTTEGRSINNSLTTLGNCVKQVAKISSIENVKEREKKMNQIAWRSSSLTRLLRTALNGKCKTIMIAAISPSLTEYPETLSTMRYASQIKQIKSTAVKKEAKLTAEQEALLKIKELEEKLAAALNGGGGGGGGDGGGGGGGGVDPAAMAELKAQMDEMKRKEEEFARKEADMAAQMQKLKDDQKARDAIRESGPHVVEILNNPMTSGLVPTAMPKDQSLLCGPADQDDAQMKLRGTQVRKSHCTFVNKGGKVSLKPGADNAACMVNGKLLTGPQELKHNDRIRIAENNYFRFMDPKVIKTLSDVQMQEDDQKYSYEFLREEALRELVSGFQQQDAEEERTRKMLEDQLAAQEKMFKEKQAQLDALLKEQETKGAAALAELSKALDAERAKAAELMAKAASQDEKDKIAADEAAAINRITKEKAELEKQLVENKLAEQKKLTAEKDAQARALRKQQEEARQKEAEKSRIQYDLMDAIPACRQANGCAKELGFSSKYEVKLISDQTPMGLKNEVCIQLSDETGASELWKIEKFRSKFGVLMQQFYDNRARLDQGQTIELPDDSPFHVSHHALQVIGHAKIMLNYIFFNMEVEDKFHIVSYTGQIAGDVQVKITPLWDNMQAKEVETVDNMRELTKLKHLDLEIEVKACSSLPPKFASDVRCEFSFPDFITNSLLPAGMKPDKMPPRPEDDVEQAEWDEKNNVQRGGSHMTPFNTKMEGKLDINPVIGYKRILRIYDLSKKAVSWFESGELVMTVSGEIPDEMGAKNVKKKSGGAAGGASAAEIAKKDQEIAELRKRLEEATTAGGGDEFLKSELKREQEDLRKARKDLSDLQKQYKELEAQKSSGACEIL